MPDYGKATNELFVQFLARIAKEIPTATIATFSTLKYVNAPNFEKFRQRWNANYMGGFVIHNIVFEGLKGKFPIGFLVWKTDQEALVKTPITEVSVDVLDRKAQPIGEKLFYNLPASTSLNSWFSRPRPNEVAVIALKNGVSPSTAKITPPTWSDGAIAYMLCDSNDMQHAEQRTSLFSSVYRVGHDGGFYVTPDNLSRSTAVFCARRLIIPTWLNDRDQFLKPNRELTDEFNNDGLVWMLFNRTQRTASANDLEWNGKTWSIVNHFIPYTEEEVNAPDRFESDFMVRYIKDKTFSQEAQSVLDEGRKLWRAYFAHKDNHTVREELKLNRADVGWYQIRKAIEKRNESGDFPPVNWKPFKSAYESLTEKLQPMVYELGFLKV
jgi:hypothetical protein